MACVPVAAQAKWPLLASSLNVLGLAGKVLVTVNGPQSYDDAEPETLSYHRPVEEEAGAYTSLKENRSINSRVMTTKGCEAP